MRGDCCQLSHCPTLALCSTPFYSRTSLVTLRPLSYLGAQRLLAETPTLWSPRPMHCGDSRPTGQVCGYGRVCSVSPMIGEGVNLTLRITLSLSRRATRSHIVHYHYSVANFLPPASVGMQERG